LARYYRTCGLREITGRDEGETVVPLSQQVELDFLVLIMAPMIMKVFLKKYKRTP
jgi:hypothetical protein